MPVEAALAAGDLEEAQRLLTAAGDAAPPALLARLAVLHYQRQAFEASERALDRLIAIAPATADLASVRLLAKLKMRAGRRDEAVALLAQAAAARPGATDFAAAYADMLPPEAAVAALESHLRGVAADPSRVAYLLLRITTIRAPLCRRARGLPAYGTSWPDTFQWPDADALPRLKHALEAELAAGSRRATARLDLAYIALAQGDWDRAETFLAALRNGPKRTPADFSAFGTAFHAGLDAMSEHDISSTLAPVQRLASPPVSSGETVMIGCDPAYFARFTLPFLRQMDAAQIAADVHIHLLDGAETEWVEVKEALAALAHVRATLTAETSGAAVKGASYARTYYHAIRYVRLYEELQRARRPVWMFDADVRLQHDPRPLLASLRTRDLALRTNPCAFEPVLKITASCVGVVPTARGLAFARRVASAIIHWKNRGTWAWGVDQLALFSSYAHMSAHGQEPHTLFLDDTAMNDKTGDIGAIKFLSGIDKYERSGV